MYKNKSTTCENIITAYTDRNPSHGFHWHEEQQLIFVLKGSLRLQISYFETTLSEGDIVLLASNDPHMISSLHPDTQVLFLMFNSTHSEKLTPYLNETLAVLHYDDGYRCLEKDNKNIASKTNELADFLFSRADYNSVDLALLNTKIENLLNQIVLSYMAGFPNSNLDNAKSSEKLHLTYRAIRFIYENHDRKLNLQELTDIEYLTLSHLSKVITSITEVSFRDWVNYVRVEHSEKLLLSTSKSIATISEECGFSNVRYFGKHFSKWHKMSPLEFRKTYKSTCTINNSNPATLKLKSNSSTDLSTITRPRKKINLDFSSNIASSKKFNFPVSFSCLFSDILEDQIGNIFNVINKELYFTELTISLKAGELSTHLTEEQQAIVRKNILHLSNLGYTITLELDYSSNPNNEIFQQVEALCQWIEMFSSNFHVKKLSSLDNSMPTLEKSTSIVQKHLQPNIYVYDLISKDGLKLPLYYYYFMVEKLSSNIYLEETNHIVTRTDDSFQVFLYNDFSLAKSNASQQYEISISGDASKYKLVHYEWSLEINDYQEFTNDPSILLYLKGEEIDLFNMMSHPNLSFEILDNTKKATFPVTLSVNNLHLIVVTPIEVLH